MKLPYDPSDKNSIIQFAKKFIGKSIQKEFEEELKHLVLSDKDKGQLGKIIEKLYFKYEPNSSAKADFENANLELKSSGLKQLKKKEYRAKERLVLNIINYIDTINENFEEDFLNGKSGHLLLIFYLYAKGLNQLNSEIKLVGDWKYPSRDIEIIKQDWQTIKQKIIDGKAHELSEGDTFYLGACTKGGKGGNPRPQPNNKILAKQRAFSLKPNYVNHIIASIAGETTEVYGKLIPSVKEAKKKTIEEIVIEKFKPFYGNSISQLVDTFKLDFINKKSKQYFALVSKAILNKILDVPQDKKASNYLEEFDKAEIQIKTIRLKENNLPKEDVSFPTFKYEELVNEDWENSNFKDILEHKFLFVFFQFENKNLVLRKVKFWNMPYSDLLKVEKVWTKTQKVVAKGEIVKGFKTDKNGKVSRETNFPNKKFSSISHVRPHATKAINTYPLPKQDKLTKQNEYTKHCFWLNNSYVRDEIYLKK
jgi:DNA mismatch repair protein MutH